MDKILVKLYVSEIQKQYDIFIPSNRRIHSIIKLLVKAINELTDGYYNPRVIPKLYDKPSGREFDYNEFVRDSDIKNGSEIVMI